MEKIISSVEKFVKNDMEGKCSAHDFYHIQRVQKLAVLIQCKEEQGNLLVVQLGALLHEYFDEKFFDETEFEERESGLAKFLESIEINHTDIHQIIFIAKNVGYGKSLERNSEFPYTIEFQIVEDADRLEAVGAIAIARTFAYGGSKNKSIYDPKVPPKELHTKADYKTGSTNSLNHFYEKLLKLSDLMHTTSGKALAQKRHEYMEGYLEQFYKERECEE